jgi:hypothetical protein
MICEQSYFNFVEWINDHNKSCSSWEVMNICNWKFLFETIYFFRIWFQYYFPSSRKKVHGKKTFLLWAVLGKIACCRRPREAHGKLACCREPLSAFFFVSLSICREFSIWPLAKAIFLWARKSLTAKHWAHLSYEISGKTLKFHPLSYVYFYEIIL